MQAAEEVFLREGYAAASMDEVARTAGMSKKTLYQLFPSKEALFEAVIEELSDFHEAIGEEVQDGHAALGAVLERMVHEVLQPRHIGMLRLIAAEVNRAPELAYAVRRGTAGRVLSALDRWILVQAEAGKLRVENTSEAAGMLFGMALGELHVQVLLGLRRPPSRATIARRVRSAVATFLNGAAVRSDRG
ncbi:MAG TPA: TetR/AcrR family transcriptional regulator [Crenalkalicoccus sp.]|nr:TetR/AcrR family transcriptional regulator [Crenalkalicoccus sp.]